MYWKAVKAGYVCSITKNEHLSIIGVPQGSIISPILSNIYLHELDVEIQNAINTYNTGVSRKRDKVYAKLTARALRLEKKEDKTSKAKAHRIRKRMFHLPSGLIKDPNFLRIVYVRYADDFLIGIIGPISLTKEIYSKILNTLSTLKLEVNPEKTKIIRAFKETKFLGTLVSMWLPSNKIYAGLSSDGKRIGNYSKINAPVDSLVRKLAINGFCDKSGKPLAKIAWVNDDIHNIMNKYNSIFLGFINYYSFVDNFARLGRIQYILQHSLAKTLCNKLRIRSRFKLFSKYGPTLKWTTTVNDRTKTSEFKLRPSNKGWVRKNKNFLINPVLDLFAIYYKRYTKSSLNNPCAICNSHLNVEMHHVRHIRKLNKRLSDFTALMAKINRKQLPVCRSCHMEIHSGNYDKISLNLISNKYISINNSEE